MTSLAIIIVTYNSRAELDDCLCSLADHKPTIAHEIVIIDNGSSNGTPAHVRERWPSVRLLGGSGNLGFAKANNLGIRETTSDLVLLLNPDVIVSPGSIDALVAALGRYPEAAVVGPRIVDGDGWPELSFGSMISPLTELRQKLLVIGNDRRAPGVSQWVDRMTRRQKQVDWVSGACLLIRRTDLEAVRLLDERFFMYAEDVDLCAAVRARGRIVLFTPDAEVVHLRGRSVASAPIATHAAYRRSHLAFYDKHHPGWAPFLRLYLRLRGELPDT
jgi:N-acetylglucosaminyl-diphospho-decaprenol L-rhamnosyltransferase